LNVANLIAIKFGVKLNRVYQKISSIKWVFDYKKGLKMAQKKKLLTTSEFAAKVGIETSKVSKLIREGKIKADKKSGKWVISQSELKAKSIQKLSKGTKPAEKKIAASVAKKSAKPKKKKATQKKPAAKSYSISDFADMTYLTESGVLEWLKQGRLIGQQSSAGDWLIEAANLEVPDIKRLVR
jgi:myosin heavy subunit